VQWIINTPSGKNPHRDEVLIRTTAMRLGVPLVTTIRGAKAFLEAVAFLRENQNVIVKAIQDYLLCSVAGAGAFVVLGRCSPLSR
jgi:carbamoyl-phosphate synthase large subunit